MPLPARDHSGHQITMGCELRPPIRKIGLAALPGCWSMGVIVEIALSVRANFLELARTIDSIGRKQLPFATAQALTDTAKAAAVTLGGELESIFDRPTPFTKRGIGATSAKKSTLTATVFVKDRQAKYLELQELGGTRSPSGKALVLPGKGMKLNSYGNLPRAAVARLRGEAAQRGRGTHDAGVAYIAGARAPGGVGGYFRREGGHRLTRLIAFAGKAEYGPRFGFTERVEAAAAGLFETHIAPRLTAAIASAK